MKIGYVPYNSDFVSHPGDYRRFCWYAKNKNIDFELANFDTKYDLVVLTQAADITLWKNYKHGKIIYDLIDSYLLIPKTNIKGVFRGLAKTLSGQYSEITFNNWKAVIKMCRRSDAVVCTTIEQRDEILSYSSNVETILDSHNDFIHDVKTNYKIGNVIRLVWEGLPDNIFQLEILKEPLAKLSRKYNIELHVVTDKVGSKYLGKYGSIKSEDVVKKIFDNSFVHSWSSDNLLKITKMCDLAIIPINLKNKLTLGKPENKLLLFWRMGIPTIVSATPSYVRAMNEAGIASFVHNTENEWIESIENVINNEKYRESVGSLGRKYVTERYNSDAIIKQWDRVFNSIGFNSIT